MNKITKIVMSCHHHLPLFLQMHCLVKILAPMHLPSPSTRRIAPLGFAGPNHPFALGMRTAYPPVCSSLIRPLIPPKSSIEANRLDWGFERRGTLVLAIVVLVVASASALAAVAEAFCRQLALETERMCHAHPLLLLPLLPHAQAQVTRQSICP